MLPVELQKMMKVGKCSTLNQLGILKHVDVEASFINRVLKQLKTPGISSVPVAYLDYQIPKKLWSKIFTGTTNGPKSKLFNIISFEGVIQVLWIEKKTNEVKTGYIIFETSDITSNNIQLPTFSNICKSVGAPENESKILFSRFFGRDFSSVLKANPKSIILPIMFNSLNTVSISTENIFSDARNLKNDNFINEVECLTIQ